MFEINEDYSIYCTKGDIGAFAVSAEVEGVEYIFKAGDVLRLKVFEKKNCDNVVLQKSFPVTEDKAGTTEVVLVLDNRDTKIGDTINKPVDYWYEVELIFGETGRVVTIIGYDDDGAKIFKLFPEGKELPEDVPSPEDMPLIDKQLDAASPRPVENQAIARETLYLRGRIKGLEDEHTALINTLTMQMSSVIANAAVEEARVTNLASLEEGSTTGDAELIDARVGANGVTYASVGEAIRTQIGNKTYKLELETADGWYNLGNGGYNRTNSFSGTQKIKLKKGRTYKIETDIELIGIAYFNVAGFIRGEYTSNKTLTVGNEEIISLVLKYTEGLKSVLIVDVTETDAIRQTLNESIANIEEITKCIGLETTYKLIKTHTVGTPTENKYDNASAYLKGKKYRFVVKADDIAVNEAYLYFYDAGNNPTYVYQGVINDTDFCVDVDMPIDDAVGFGIMCRGITGASNVSVELYEVVVDSSRLVATEKKKIHCYGDSITQSVRATSDETRYPALLERLLGDFKVNNFGVSGATTTNICARLGGIPTKLTRDVAFESGVKEKTFTSVTDADFFTSTYLGYATNLINPAGYPNFNPCYIDGHKCNIYVPGVDTLRIELLEDNGGITLKKDSLIYFNGSKDALDGIDVIMMGTNGVYYGSTVEEKARDYVEQYVKCAKFIGHGKHLMLSQFNTHSSGESYEAYKTAQVDYLEQLKANESLMEYEFGQKFINMRKELVNNGLKYAISGGYLDENALVDANNLDAIANGIVPPSLLSSDFVHPSDAGNYAMAYIVSIAINALYK